MAGTRNYQSIGEVLVSVKTEFPDITISKIRFLEAEGLIEPERTPSGYRKFYSDDVERLTQPLLCGPEPSGGPLQRAGQVVVAELHGAIRDLLNLVPLMLRAGELRGYTFVIQVQFDHLLAHPAQRRRVRPRRQARRTAARRDRLHGFGSAGSG